MCDNLQSEAKRFLAALEKRCQLAGSSEVSVGQLYALGSDINLTMPDMEAFIGQLNEAGAALNLSHFLSFDTATAAYCQGHTSYIHASRGLS